MIRGRYDVASGSRRIAGTMIMLSRLFYAMNWYNISPALGDIVKAFNVNPSLEGLLLSAFLIGAGVFQIPAGIISARIGAKNTAMIGMLVMSASVMLSAFSSSFIELLMLRFITGLSAAFFFSTAIGIINDLYSSNVTSMIGLYNGFFAIGGGIGIALFTPIVVMFGWRMDMLISGAVTLIVTIISIFTIPSVEAQGVASMKEVYRRLTSKTIWLVALGLEGVWALNFTFSEIFKNYAHNVVGIPGDIAGIMGGLILFSGIIGGYLTGVMKRLNRLRLVFVIPLFLGAMVAMIPLLDVIGLWGVTILEGTFATVVISLEYGLVVQIDKDSKYVPLNVGIANSIQIGVGSTIPFAFTFIAYYGYSYSWLFLGIFGFITLPLLGIAIKKGFVASF